MSGRPSSCRRTTTNLMTPNSGGGVPSSPSTPPVSGSVAIASSLLNSDNQSQVQSNMASFKLMLLVMMVLQNSATVLVGRYTRAGVPKSELCDVNHLIVVVELGKLLLSAALEFYATQGKLLQSLHTHVYSNPMDTVKILVPALLYLVQNTLLYIALANLTAPIFQVTYQAKLVTTALVSVLMLQRSYSAQQWICLFILSLGVAVVVLGEQKSTSSGSSDEQRLAAVSGAAAQNLPLGLLAVSIACMSSALAGVYFEMVLKKPNTDATKQAPASLWMRNIQLSFFSVVIAYVQGFFREPPAVSVPYLHGFSSLVWVLVVLQAGGGLLVAAIIKYADNVLKGLATGVSVVLATALSILLFGTPLTGQFSLGAGMILAAVYYFSNSLPAALFPPTKKVKDGEQMMEVTSLLPK